MASFQGLEHFLLHFSGREGHKSDMGHNKLETGHQEASDLALNLLLSHAGTQ